MNVKIGQVWVDDHSRNKNVSEPRRGTVVDLDSTHAHIAWNTEYAVTRVRISRLESPSTGYRLSKDVAA